MCWFLLRRIEEELIRLPELRAPTSRVLRERSCVVAHLGSRGVMYR